MKKNMKNVHKFDTWVTSAHEKNLVEIMNLVTKDVLAKLNGNGVYDIRGMELNGYNFTFADFRGFNMADIEINGCNLSQASFEDSLLNDSNILNSNFTNSNLNFSNLENTTITNCNLTKVKFHSTDLLNATFTKCNFTDSRYLYFAKNLFSCKFIECDFLGVDFSSANKKEIKKLNSIFFDCHNIKLS